MAQLLDEKQTIPPATKGSDMFVHVIPPFIV
jgi:hypothetical protein